MIRLMQESDIEQVVGLMYEINSLAQYSRGLRLNQPLLSKIMVSSLTKPSIAPCFLHFDDDVAVGILFGFVVDTFFDDQRWFEERVFYIREGYRTYPLARAFIKTLEKWCREQGVARIEVGNGFLQEPRIAKLYERLGFHPVNTTHAKRL
jgi:GNAT superfamily N-acetyltransferase